MDKGQRIGRLPGGFYDYLATIVKCLIFIEQQKPSEASFCKWVQSQFPSLKSKRVLLDRIRTIRSLGFITETNGELIINHIGKTFLLTKSKKLLFERLEKRYVGFKEIIELLLEKPSTLKEINSYLKSNADINWKTESQTSIRLTWLLGLGYIKKSGSFFNLNQEASENICPKEKETNESLISHSEIAEKIFETGKVLGYISEKEYKVENRSLDVIWKTLEQGTPTDIFEIHLNGSLSDAIMRLKFARSMFGLPELHLVTDLAGVVQANKMIKTCFRELDGLIKIKHWKEIDELRDAYLSFREKSGEFWHHPKKVFLRKK